jgi:hypothetical protein
MFSKVTSLIGGVIKRGGELIIGSAETYLGFLRDSILGRGIDRIVGAIALGATLFALGFVTAGARWTFLILAILLASWGAIEFLFLT